MEKLAKLKPKSDYVPCDMEAVLSLKQQTIMKRFFSFLIQSRALNHLSTARAMRLFRIELNGRFFRVKDGKK